MIGQRFGSLTVVSRAPNNKWRERRWDCRCDCGNEKTVDGSTLRNGLIMSCGCLHGITHGHAHSREYRIWDGIKQRCLNLSNKAYPDYGGRGIKVCGRWLNFENFLADMGNCPTQKHCIERINNDGNYEPFNCRWATRREQMLNTRRTKMLTACGKTMCMKDWGRELGVHETSVAAWVKKGIFETKVKERATL